MTAPADRAVRKGERDFLLGVLWSTWWLHKSHGEDTYAQDILIESVGRHGLAAIRRLAQREQYQFERGFWPGVQRRANR